MKKQITGELLKQVLRGGRRGYSLWCRHTLGGEERVLCRTRKGRLRATEISNAGSLRGPKSPWFGDGTETCRGRLVA